jgi:hypothetical protein
MLTDLIESWKLSTTPNDADASGITVDLSLPSHASSAMLRDCSNEAILFATLSVSIGADASGFIASNALQTCYYNNRRRWQAKRVSGHSLTKLES